jgi:hypothetical protein
MSVDQRSDPSHIVVVQAIVPDGLLGLPQLAAPVAEQSLFFRFTDRSKG